MQMEAVGIYPALWTPQFRAWHSLLNLFVVN